MFPIIKYQVRREKIKFFFKVETTVLGKSFMQNWIKSRKYFFCTPVSKIQKISTSNICNGAKLIYLKKQKKEILRRDTLQISLAAVLSCTVKKVSLNILPPVYLPTIKIDINQWTATCLNLSKSWYQKKQSFFLFSAGQSIKTCCNSFY